MARVLDFTQLSDRLDLKKKATEEKYYHNAKKLLWIYNKVMWQMEHSLNDMHMECADLGYTDLREALDFLATGLDDELEAIKLKDNAYSLLFNHSLIQVIDKALLALKDYPLVGERYFDIINKMYILKYNYSEEEMLTTLGISRRTLYREKKKAVSMLGVILWGFMLPDIMRSLRDTKMALNWHVYDTELALICD